MAQDDLSFHIPGKKIRDRVRKTFNMNPGTKVESVRKDKRVQNSLKHQIDEAFEETILEEDTWIEDED